MRKTITVHLERWCTTGDVREAGKDTIDKTYRIKKLVNAITIETPPGNVFRVGDIIDEEDAQKLLDRNNRENYEVQVVAPSLDV